MRTQKTAYELARSQVATPPEVVKLFWRITHQYRSRFANVLDLGAGDGRFALGGHYGAYEGIEIDPTRQRMPALPANATIRYGCAFRDVAHGYSACIGNPPYVQHHHLEPQWRDTIARRLHHDTDESLNRKCNLYIYFLFLAILKSAEDGLVSTLVPYEWVSRPSAAPLRRFIQRHGWHVDTYKFTQPIFPDVLTTASISVIDKRNRDGQWKYLRLTPGGVISELTQMTGSSLKILPYEDRGQLWAMRGMSPGTQDVFTLNEGERIHAGLDYEDVLPCVTSLRAAPRSLSRLTIATFRRHFVDAGAKCWLIKSHVGVLSPRMQAYLNSIPAERHDTSTCTSRDLWYRYPMCDAPDLLVSTGFTTFGPKVLVNSIRARAVGSVCGVHSRARISVLALRQYLVSIDFERRLVPHAKQLKKIEIRQLNAVLNDFQRWEDRHA